MDALLDSYTLLSQRGSLYAEEGNGVNLQADLPVGSPETALAGGDQLCPTDPYRGGNAVRATRARSKARLL